MVLCIARHVVPSFLLSLSVVAAQDHRSGYHWARDTSHFTLGVVNSLKDDGQNDWEDHFEWAIDEWTKSEVMDLAELPGTDDDELRQICPELDGYVHVCNADYGFTVWAGIAEWTYSVGKAGDAHDGHMLSCSVRLNDNESAIDEEKKLLCHEIGHCLGLGHTSVNGQSDGSCMDYSTGVEDSRAPGKQDYRVLEDVYKHLDGWNSYELVEPDRDETPAPQSPDTPEPTAVPTASPTSQPVQPDSTPAPTDPSTSQPTSKPVASLTPAPTLEATSSPTRPNDQGICGQHETKNDCKKDKDICEWDKDEEVCLQKEADQGGSGGSQSCSDYSKDKDCKKDDSCSWDKDSKECLVKGSDPDAAAGDGGTCSVHTEKDACKDEKECKWKKNECIQDRRRSLAEECMVDPVKFDVPEDAEVVACDGNTVTFEVIESEHIVRRYHFILSRQARRHRHLLG